MQRFSKIANDALILAGFMLLLMQLHGYQHNSNSDEFGFSEDEIGQLEGGQVIAKV